MAEPTRSSSTSTGPRQLPPSCRSPLSFQRGAGHRSLPFLVAVLLLLIVVVGGGALFTVSQPEQAIVLVSPSPRGTGLITEPGLVFKIPLSRTWCSPTNRISRPRSDLEVLASDNQRLKGRQFRPLIRSSIHCGLPEDRRRHPRRGRPSSRPCSDSAVRHVLSQADQQQYMHDERAALIVKIRGAGRSPGASISRRGRRRPSQARRLAAAGCSRKVFGHMRTKPGPRAGRCRAPGAEQTQKIATKADRDVIVLEGRGAAPSQTRIEGKRERRAEPSFRRAYGKKLTDFFAFYRRCRRMRRPSNRATRISDWSTLGVFSFFWRAGRAKSPSGLERGGAGRAGKETLTRPASQIR